MNTQEIKNRMAYLRELWTKYPEKRKTIEIQGKLLQKALELKERKQA